MFSQCNKGYRQVLFSEACCGSRSGLRIKYRWEAIDSENEILKQAKDKKTKPQIRVLKTEIPENSSWARSGYLLYKTRDKWTENQSIRAEILFNEYPDLEKAYNLSYQLRKIYNQNKIFLNLLPC